MTELERLIEEKRRELRALELKALHERLDRRIREHEKAENKKVDS